MKRPQGAGTLEWSTEERLHELKGKLNLKERDNEAYFRYSQETIQSNEKLINELRQKVRQQRVTMASCLDGDTTVIETALASQRLDVLTYKRATASKCIEEKNQDVFDQVKKLNSIQHQIRCHQQTIDELELTLKNKTNNTQTVHDRRNKTIGHDISDQRVRVLSTRLDKVLLKINSARYVNTTYKRLLSYLEKDSLSLPSRLDDLESCLEQQKQELFVLRKIHSESKQAADNTKLDRYSLEDKIIVEKNTRDQKLSKVRKTVKTLNEEAENANVLSLNQNRKIGKDKKNENSGRESHFFTPHKARQKAALASALNLLKESCGASTIDDISDNFERQLKRQQQLLSEAENFQKMREQLQATLVHAEENLTRNKFEASLKLNAAHQPEEELIQKDETLVNQMQQLGVRRNSVDQNVQKIKLAMNLFYTKCRDINSKLPEKETSNSRIKEIIDSTFKPIISKMDQQLVSEDTTDREEAALIDYLPNRNMRIDLPKEEEDDGADVNNLNNAEGGEKKKMFEDDDDELVESNYHSRDDIKKKSGELVKIHATGKKKH
jgi:hypothetical protein